APQVSLGVGVDAVPVLEQSFQGRLQQVLGVSTAVWRHDPTRLEVLPPPVEQPLYAPVVPIASHGSPPSLASQGRLNGRRGCPAAPHFFVAAGRGRFRPRGWPGNKQSSAIAARTSPCRRATDKMPITGCYACQFSVAA